MEENEFKFHVKAFDVKSTIAMLLFFSEKDIEFDYDIETPYDTLTRSAILNDLTTPAEFVKIFGKFESIFDNLIKIQEELRDDFLAGLKFYKDESTSGWKQTQECLAVNAEDTKKILKFKEMVFS